MADQKITALAEDTAPDDTNLLYSIDDPGGSPLSRKATIANAVGSYTAQYVLLDDTTLGIAGNFDVSSIPATYDDLLILLMLRSDVASTGDDAAVFFNNDTTASNYHRAKHIYEPVGAGHAINLAANSEIQCAADSSPANAFTMCRIYIPHYADTTYEKLCLVEASGGHRAANSERVQTITIVWVGTNTAINRITIQPDGYSTDNFMINSRMRLIGIKYT